MKFDFRHIDPVTGLPEIKRNNEPEILLMNRLPQKSGWIIFLLNRIGLNTVGNKRYQKKMWYDRRDCTVSSDLTKQDTVYFRNVVCPGMGRPAGWIYATDIRESVTNEYKSLNTNKDLKKLKKDQVIIFWTSDNYGKKDAAPCIGCIVFDKKNNPSKIGILNPIAKKGITGYVEFDQIEKWDLISNVFPNTNNEAILDNLSESKKCNKYNKCLTEASIGKIKKCLTKPLNESNSRTETITYNMNLTDSDAVVISDPCYVLTDDIYDIWGANKFKDGMIGDSIGLVHSTYEGDGNYDSSTGKMYGVDAGTLGIYDINECKELIKKDITKDKDNITIIKLDPTKEYNISMTYDNGTFMFYINDKEVEVIYTEPVEDEYDDYDEDYEDYDEDYNY